MSQPFGKKIKIVCGRKRHNRFFLFAENHNERIELMMNSTRLSQESVVPFRRAGQACSAFKLSSCMSQPFGKKIKIVCGKKRHNRFFLFAENHNERIELMMISTRLA
jgi:hypothetical protein